MTAADRPRTGSAMQRAYALYDEGRFEDAAADYLRVIEATPENADAWCMLGTCLLVLGHAEDASVALRTALTRQPDHVDALNNLGGHLLGLGRTEEGLELCLRAVKAAPEHYAARANLGAALLDSGWLIEAEVHLRRAIEIDPGPAMPHDSLGSVYLRAGLLEPAAESFRAALERDGHDPETWVHLGMALHDLGHLEESEAAYRRALALSPEHADAHANLGIHHLTVGRRNEALHEFEIAHANDPQNLTALSSIIELREIGPDDPRFGLLDSAVSADGGPPGRKMLAHFALAKACDGAQRYDEAFAHYRQGHRARARHLGHRYDAERYDDLLRHVRSSITRDFFRERADWALEDASPIFVVGMPRSGTSLIEQILASHSLVHGAGELLDLADAARRLTGEEDAPRDGGKRPLPDFEALVREAARDEGRAYLRTLHGLGGDAVRVVDKMPHNFEHLWLVALLFPGATVLHSVRSPLDTCVSCYFQKFTVGHPYTDDLTSLGHHYRYYHALMEHWKAVLPLEIHDIVYEHLVTDPDAEIRALVETCGLDFEPACLDFHRTKRAVRTASVTQVRKRAYSTSVGSWQKYRAHLEPLVEALEPVLASDDLAPDAPR